MVVLAGKFLVAFAVGGIVVKQVHAPQKVRILHHRTGVGEVGVAAHRGRRGGKHLVGNHPAVGGGEVSPTPNPLDLRARNAVLLDALGNDMPTAHLFSEQEPVARHTVFQWESRHVEVLVRENQRRFLSVDRMDADFEFGVGDEEVDLCLQDVHEIGRHVEMDVGGAFVERQRREQPDQPEAVVAVGVADEDVLQLSGVESVPQELRLRALAAVDHVQFAAVADNLRGGVMP